MGATRRRLTNKAALAVQPQKPRPTNLRMPSGKGWYRIENHRQASSATVYLYDEIGLWGITASDFVRELSDVDAKHIDVHINSPGGDVFDGIAIYNALANHTATVTTYVDGLAASAASFIAQAGSPVKIARNAAMMIHDAEGICIGNCADMLEMADLLDAASNNIADIYAQKSGNVAQWRERMKATTWYHSGQDAVEAGLADEVYEPDQGDDDTEGGSDGSDMAAATARQHTGRLTNKACPTHHTDTVDKTWDANEQTKNLPTPIPLSDVKKVYAWYDDSRVENDEIPKDGCKLPHHEVSNDGTPGAANMNGCQNALSRLSQSDIPEAEQEACRKHLQAHLDDEETSEGEGENESEGASDSLADAVFAFSPDMLVGAFTNAITEAKAPPFDVDQFRLTMATVAANCPAIADNEPLPVDLPALPEPDQTPRCECGRALPCEGVNEQVLDPATIQHILYDVTNNAPGLPDVTGAVPDIGEPVNVIDPLLFQQALRRGLL